MNTTNVITWIGDALWKLGGIGAAAELGLEFADGPEGWRQLRVLPPATRFGAHNGARGKAGAAADSQSCDT